MLLLLLSLFSNSRKLAAFFFFLLFLPGRGITGLVWIFKWEPSRDSQEGEGCHLWRNSILKDLSQSYGVWTLHQLLALSTELRPRCWKTGALCQGFSYIKSAQPEGLQRANLKNAQNTFFCCLFVLFHSHKKRLFLWTGYKSHPQEESITLKNLGKIKPPWLGASWPRILIWLFFSFSFSKITNKLMRKATSILERLVSFSTYPQRYQGLCDK